MASKEAAERKRLLFDSIFALDNDRSDEYDEDEGLIASRDMFVGVNDLSDSPSSSPPPVKRATGLHRSFSTPTPAQHSNRASSFKRASALEMLNEAEAVKDTPFRRLRKSVTTTGVDSLRRSSLRDLHMPHSSTIPGLAGKRKRDHREIVEEETPALTLRRSTTLASSRLGATPTIPASSDVSTSNPIPTLRKSATVTGVGTAKDFIIPTSSAIPRLPGKKKGEAKIKLVPEDQRVFSGLHFCKTCNGFILCPTTDASSLLSKRRHQPRSPYEDNQGSRIWSNLAKGLECVRHTHHYRRGDQVGSNHSLPFKARRTCYRELSCM